MADLFGVSVEELLSADTGQKTSKKAVGKSTVSKEVVPAERTKTQKERFVETVVGLSEVLTRDF